MVNCDNNDTGTAALCCASPAGDGCGRLQMIMTGLTVDIEQQDRHVREEILLDEEVKAGLNLLSLYMPDSMIMFERKDIMVIIVGIEKISP